MQGIISQLPGNCPGSGGKVHYGLPWQDADHGEGAKDVTLRTAEVRHGENIWFVHVRTEYVS